MSTNGSEPTLLSLAQHLADVLAALPVNEALAVGIYDAVGLVLSVDVVSVNASPRDTVAACDGVAVRANDTVGAAIRRPVALQVTGAASVASDMQSPIVAPRVRQGEPLPYGYDAVLPVSATFAESRPFVVTSPVPAGQQVATAGSDIAPQQLLAVKGHMVTPADVALLATAGVDHVLCVPAPRIVVLGLAQADSTGFAGTQASDTRAVTMMVAAHVRSLGAMVFLGEETSATRDALALTLDANLGRADLIILVGGTRARTQPRVAAVLSSVGSASVRSIAVESCQNQLFGMVGSCPVVAVSNLPGSAHREFELLLRPVVRHLQGRRDGARPSLSARLTEPVVADATLDRYVAVRLQRMAGEWTARPLSENTVISSVTVSQTDGYLKMASGQAGYPVGAVVAVELAGE
ncbi:MAG: hypothetical protein WD360_02725 [Nitriliruptoraceae bacterium]